MPKKAPRSEAVPATLAEAIEYFADPDVALAYMVTMRWPDGEIACPECGSRAVRFLAKRRGWQCGSHHLRRTFSVKTGTVMEDSPIPLNKWLTAIWLLVNCKNGVSSYEVARDLDLTQKSAWFLLQRIRLALQEGTLLKIGGSGKTVEVDETFIGVKARSMNAKTRRKAAIGGVGPHGAYKYTGKALVMGMLERGGKVVAKVVRDRSRNTLLPHVATHVNPCTKVMTDEHHSYEGLVRPRYEHEVIDHTAAYVDGLIHTNNIENFWSLLKRGLKGTYISVEPFHLFRYLDEQAYRFNARHDTDQNRFLEALRRLAGKRLTYRQLIGEGQLEAHSPA